jgi:hypothetical protein
MCAAEGGDAGATADGPSWHHRGTGVPGGVGQPQNSSVEQLYMLGGKHFHLHQAQFDQDGGRGGDVGNNGKARSAYLTYPVAKSNGSEEPTTYTFRAEDVNSLPLHDSQWSFSSCAIVSNSASMLKAQLGVEIDAHEVRPQRSGAIALLTITAAIHAPSMLTLGWPPCEVRAH